MAPTTMPLRMRILDRYVEVLEAIVPGSTYHLPPYQVLRGFRDHSALGGFPTYMVALESSPGPPESAGERQDFELVGVSVKGWVDLEGGQAEWKREKAIADVRTAIMADCLPSAGAGSLAALVLTSELGMCETDSGFLAVEGRGYFDQAFIHRISIAWGTL